MRTQRQTQGIPGQGDDRYSGAEVRGCGHSGSSPFRLSFQSLSSWTSDTNKQTGDKEQGRTLGAAQPTCQGDPSWQCIEACPMLENLISTHGTLHSGFWSLCLAAGDIPRSGSTVTWLAKGQASGPLPSVRYSPQGQGRVPAGSWQAHCALSLAARPP